MKNRRIWILSMLALLLTTTGGYVAYTRTQGAQAQEPQEPTMKTDRVTQGDIILTADGTGELIPARDVKLSFRTSGRVAELLVETGDVLAEGDLLARLVTESLERALAEVDLALQIARLELAAVREGPSEAQVANAEAKLRDAQTQLTLAYDSYQRATNDSNGDAVESAKVMLDWWVGYYQSEKAKYERGEINQTKHDYAMAAMIKAEETWERAKNQAKISEVQASKSVNQARNAVLQAEADLELLQSQPLTSTLMAAELKVDEATLAREEARGNLEAAALRAPFDGTVIDIAVQAGDQVGAHKTILTVANLQEPLLRLWLEESDMQRVAVGNQVNVIFDALPDTTFTGTVARVDPMLVTVSGTSAVQAEARLFLDDDRDVALLSGMTADVEVISAEARGALLVPLEALRESPEGRYAVLVVTVDGEVVERQVEVGLQGTLNAQILSGLRLGETVAIED